MHNNNKSSVTTTGSTITAPGDDIISSDIREKLLSFVSRQRQQSVDTPVAIDVKTTWSSSSSSADDSDIENG
jgi:hypothetical protein